MYLFLYRYMWHVTTKIWYFTIHVLYYSLMHTNALFPLTICESTCSLNLFQTTQNFIVKIVLWNTVTAYCLHICYLTFSQNIRWLYSIYLYQWKTNKKNSYAVAHQNVMHDNHHDTTFIIISTTSWAFMLSKLFMLWNAIYQSIRLLPHCHYLKFQYSCY